jgi:argininosuccinate lyase
MTASPAASTGAPGDADRFPAPVYRDTVLAPLFEEMKRGHRRHLMRVHRAHAVMLAERGLLTAAQARDLLDALEAIDADVAARLPAIAYTGEHEDFFFFVEAELKARVGADTAGRLHTGRSRNDMDHTMFKMELRERLLGLDDALGDLLDALLDAATRHRDTLVVAYTHGQPAQPTTWGHYLAALVEALLRDAERLSLAYDHADRSSMGAAAITTTGFPLDRRRVADLLGFERVQENAYGCIAACDYTTGAYAALKLLFLGLGRFVQDLGQRTAFEVGHLHVPDGFVQKSSIMPQKRNPVPVEHLRLMCSLGAGRCDAVMTAMHNTPFADMNDNEHEVHAAGYEAFATADRALALLRGFVSAVRIDGERVRRDIARSCITITEVADSLVRAEGISFVQAHEVCARLARRMTARGETLDDLPFAAFAEAFAGVMGRPPRIAEGDLRRFASPENFVAVRTLPGGPAPAPMDAALAGYRAELGRMRARTAARRARIDGAERALGDAVAGLRRRAAE